MFDLLMCFTWAIHYKWHSEQTKVSLRKYNEFISRFAFHNVW